MAHSSIVGGSTAKRVINCPGSVALVQSVPPRPAGKYAEEGTLLHNVIAEILSKDMDGIPFDLTDTQREKIEFAISALEQVDPMYSMRMAVEEVVSFGDFLPGVFGSCDLLGRIGDKAIVLDWKFGDGVMVEVEENEQLMFYAAAAMRTEKVSWVFDGAREIECVIVQPPFIKRWTTSFDRIRQFERELAFAVRESQKPTAVIRTGEHCRFCNAKSICPEQSGAAARALAVQVKALPVADLGQYLAMADQIEAWIEDVRALALQAMEAGGSVPGYKLVAKRATRKWADEAAAREALLSQLPESEVMEASLISPAQAEKKLKKVKGTLPETVSLSSGSALAPESDPRPPVLLIGQQLSAALGNLV